MAENWNPSGLNRRMTHQVPQFPLQRSFGQTPKRGVLKAKNSPSREGPGPSLDRFLPSRIEGLALHCGAGDDVVVKLPRRQEKRSLSICPDRVPVDFHGEKGLELDVLSLRQASNQQTRKKGKQPIGVWAKNNKKACSKSIPPLFFLLGIFGVFGCGGALAARIHLHR